MSLLMSRDTSNNHDGYPHHIRSRVSGWTLKPGLKLERHGQTTAYNTAAAVVARRRHDSYSTDEDSGHKKLNSVRRGISVPIMINGVDNRRRSPTLSVTTSKCSFPSSSVSFNRISNQSPANRSLHNVSPLSRSSELGFSPPSMRTTQSYLGKLGHRCKTPPPPPPPRSSSRNRSLHRMNSNDSDGLGTPRLFHASSLNSLTRGRTPSSPIPIRGQRIGATMPTTRNTYQKPDIINTLFYQKPGKNLPNGKNYWQVDKEDDYSHLVSHLLLSDEDTVDNVPSKGSRSVSPGMSSGSDPPFLQSVLKKPGSYGRGHKTLKKVAFLDNTSNFRGGFS